MVVTPGTSIGPYEVVAPLGAGGMGEVYRARDTRLHRDVALKLLPATFTADADRLARFEREAQVLAALNHPNIAQIYGLESAPCGPVLVMELVDGATLAERVATGPVPLDEALAIGKQIATALEAAHERGIVHRDLKPANVKVRGDGAAKVLDFGLAKALEPPAPDGPAASISPTISVHATHAGMILGTAAYLSPEQARGRPADTRADVWAFGAVLFEMLTGRRAFEGDDISDIVASVLKSEPAWQRLPGDTPEAIRRLLRRCLRKDRQQRLQHIGDVRIEIEDAQQAPPPPAPRRGIPGRAERLAWAVALAAAAAVAIIGWRVGMATGAQETRVEIVAPGVQTFALSPDGRKIVYSADTESGRHLWIRFLDQTAPQPLRGTEGGAQVFWKPDSESIGFFTANELKTLDLESGESRSLARVLTPAGGTWGADGTILYVPSDNGGVFRIPDSGGESTPVTPPRTPALATRLPQLLPDGRHFVFYVARGGEPAGVYLGELGSSRIRRLVAADAPARFGSGHLWFVRGNTLFAQRFDPAAQELSGPVSRVADDVAVAPLAAAISVSAAEGTIAYRTALGLATPVRLVWFDESGKEGSAVGEAGWSNPSLAPGGRRLVVQRELDIWVVDLERNVPVKLTDNPLIDAMPLWAPDGNRILYASERGDRIADVVRTLNTGTDDELPLPRRRGARIVTDWSRNFILYKELNEQAGDWDMWLVPDHGRGTPRQVSSSRYNERDGQLSSDERWLAYESDEQGRPEIFLQPLTGQGEKVRISTEGGRQVRWRPDGAVLFYIAADDTLMSVPIGPDGPSGPAVPLFKTRIAPLNAISRQQYVVAPDGKRFLINTRDPDSSSPIALILNWKPPSPRD